MIHLPFMPSKKAIVPSMPFKDFDEQYAIILSMCNAYISKELSVLPKDAELNQSVIFNLCSFEFTSMTTEDGRRQFTRLMTEGNDQLTICRLVNLQRDIELRIEERVIDILKYRFNRYLKKTVHMVDEDIVGYTTTIPFMYLIPLLQLTYSVR